MKSKKAYTSPELKKWGRVVELTQGQKFPSPQGDKFTGSVAPS